MKLMEEGRQYIPPKPRQKLKDRNGAKANTPGPVRTASLRFRKPPLYPIELRGPFDCAALTRRSAQGKPELQPCGAAL